MQKLLAALFFYGLAVLFTVNAWAFNATDHVAISPYGKGDVLIFPAYFTGGGWETKLTVINTSLTESVVAKVAFRSMQRGQDLRDIFIYLSPADVWTGSLYENFGEGRPYLFSDDDSVINVVSDWASATNPLNIHLEDACPGDTNMFGYVTVIQAVAFNLGRAPVNKRAIRDAYNAWIGGTGAGNDPVNVLAGHMEIRNKTNLQSASLYATVLQGYLSFDRMTGMTETLLGLNANNNLLEIEAALSKNSLAIPYYALPKGLTLSTFTFPTKLAGFPCGIDNWLGHYGGFPTPSYTMALYNLTANTIEITDSTLPRYTLPAALNFDVIAELPFGFTEGWYLIELPAGSTDGLAADGLTTISYSGAPIIATHIRADANGQMDWSYVAHTPGMVMVDGVVDGSYPYWGGRR